MLLNILLLFVSSLFVQTSDSVQTEAKKFINLGPQISKAAIGSGAFVTDDQKRDLFYTVVRGEPAHLLGYDLKDNKFIVNLPLNKIQGSWGITQSTDGWVYISSAEGGRVYKHRPGSQQVEDLGQALKGEIYLWETVAGKDGEIFGTTYPGCRVFRYHPNDGFSDVGKGPLVNGQDYVRCIAYHERTGKIYAGIGSHAYLIELDPKTGNKKQILPENLTKKAGFVYPVTIVPDLVNGDRLFATVAGKTLVYNLSNNLVEKELPGISSLAISKSPENEKIYFSFSSNNLQTFDFAKPNEPATKIGNSAKAWAMKWIKGELYIVNAENKLLKYNPKTGKTVSTTLNFPEQPIKIRLTAKGPDGRIWTSGYPVGNNAAYNPKNGHTEKLNGLSQSESMVADGKYMYFGNYSGANIHVYDSSLPWDVAKGNPKKIIKIVGQDRPFGAVAIPDHEKVFFGTVPNYGVLGGVLTAYDTKADTFLNYGEIIPKLSIVSLAYKDGLVIGGTSIHGGLGIKPALSEAKLFGWSVAEAKKEFELTPIPGAKNITGLITGPDGNIWGVVNGTLFIFDPSIRKIISTHKILDKFVSGRWSNTILIVHPNGSVYGTSSDNLIRIDPVTKETTLLRKNASWLSMDDEGRLYFADGKNLWQYTP